MRPQKIAAPERGERIVFIGNGLAERDADFRKRQQERADSERKAQEEQQKIKGSINRFVSRTLELGRLPAPEDFHSCGSSCSCG